MIANSEATRWYFSLLPSPTLNCYFLMIREAGNHWSTSVISHEYLKSHKDIPCPDFSSCGKELWCWGDSRGNQLTSATEPCEGTELGRGRKYFLIVVALCSVCGCLCLLQILKDLQRMSQAFPESVERMGIWLV